MEPEPKPPKKRKQKNPPPTYINLTAFKQAEKQYKLYQHQETDFTGLYTPGEGEKLEVDGYEIWMLPEPKGAYLVKKFLTDELVMEVGLMGLNVFCKKPYRTNLDSREQLYIEVGEKGEKQQQEKQEERQNVVDVEKDVKQKGYVFNDKIRWANVGYQYDWSLRQYPQNRQTPMHPLVSHLSSMANTLHNKLHSTKHNYKPESAIINYYGVKDYMTGHLDDAQLDQSSPIYSFSFGLSCVFLMGGRTKDIKPVAVRLDSGDLFVMAEESRKCYHGVPRVLEGTYKAEVQPGKKDGEEDNQWKNRQEQVQQYYKTHRININIRQVYPEMIKSEL